SVVSALVPEFRLCVGVRGFLAAEGSRWSLSWVYTLRARLPRLLVSGAERPSATRFCHPFRRWRRNRRPICCSGQLLAAVPTLWHFCYGVLTIAISFFSGEVGLGLKR